MPQVSRPRVIQETGSDSHGSTVIPREARRFSPVSPTCITCWRCAPASAWHARDRGLPSTELLAAGLRVVEHMDRVSDQGSRLDPRCHPCNRHDNLYQIHVMSPRSESRSIPSLDVPHKVRGNFCGRIIRDTQNSMISKGLAIERFIRLRTGLRASSSRFVTVNSGALSDQVSCINWYDRPVLARALPWPRQPPLSGCLKVGLLLRRPTAYHTSLLRHGA